MHRFLAYAYKLLGGHENRVELKVKPKIVEWDWGNEYIWFI